MICTLPQTWEGNVTSRMRSEVSCWNDSADLKQPDTKPNSKVHKNAIELRAASFVRGRHILLHWGWGEVGLDYSMLLLLVRALLCKPQASSTSLKQCTQVKTGEVLDTLLTEVKKSPHPKAPAGASGPVSVILLMPKIFWFCEVLLLHVYSW